MRTSDEEHAQRVAGSCAATSPSRTRRVPWFWVGSAIAMLDFSRMEKGPISINGDVGRRAEVGVSKGGHVRRWPAKAERHGAIKPSVPVLLLKANQLVAVPSIGVLLCVPAIVAVTTRGRDNHEGVSKQERWFANG